MYYYIYKITCTTGSLKDHYYIGQHKTSTLDDGYKGSGVMINKYYKKHPNDYVKEILCWCKDENELNEKEDFYVGNLYETDPLCLNLRSGGSHFNLSMESIQKIANTKKGKPSNRKGVTLSDDTKHKISCSVKSAMNNDEIKHKLSEYAKQRIGSKNPAAKIIIVDGRKFTCMKYAAEYLNVCVCYLRKFKHRHNSGDYYKGHKIEW